VSGLLARRPPAVYEQIGEGEHSRVFRQPASPWCLQLFTTTCPDLTVEKIRTEDAYLRGVYSPTLPMLLPAQRLFAPDRTDVHVSDTVLAKRWVDVDPTPLHHHDPASLPTTARADLHRFLTLTRRLLADAAALPTLLPDIIDDQFRNLVLDRHGRLRLLDTNRLINTDALRALPPHGRLDVASRFIHGRVLHRLMFLDARFRGRSRAQLCADPVYARWLTPDGFELLFERSTAAGEPL